MTTKFSIFNIFELFFEGGLDKKQTAFFQIIATLFFGIGLFNILTFAHIEKLHQAPAIALFVLEVLGVNITIFKNTLAGRMIALILATLTLFISLAFFESTLLIKGSLMIFIGTMIFFEKKNI